MTKPRQELLDLGRRCLTEWHALLHSISVAHLEITQALFDQLADVSSNFSEDAIFSAASEISLFLSAFVDTPRLPDAKKLAELSDRANELEALLRGDQAASAKLVFFLGVSLVQSDAEQSAQEESALLIEAACAQFDFKIRSFTSVDKLMSALNSTFPDALLSDVSMVATLVEQLERAEARQPKLAGLSVVALADAGSNHERLRSALAGAERYVERGEPHAMARQIAELLDNLANNRAPNKTRAENGKVLLIDADSSSASICKNALSQRGLQVHHFGLPNTLSARSDTEISGPSLPALMDSLQPDLVIACLSGFSNAEAIHGLLIARAAISLLPIIWLMEAHEIPVQFEKRFAGADDCISKPIRPRILIANLLIRLTRVQAIKTQLLSQDSDHTGHKNVATGMLRRANFLEQLARWTSDAPAEAALVWLSIDQVDTKLQDLGMIAKSDLEQAIAQRLSAVLHPSDMLCVLESYDFGLLLARSDQNSTVQACERLLNAVLEKPFRIRGHEVRLSASLGVSIERELRAEPEHWLSAAHSANALASKLGGNRIDGLGEALPPGMTAERAAIIRVILEREICAQQVLLEFQPLAQLRGALPGQYALRLLLRDRRTPIKGITRAEYWPIARMATKLAEFDNLALKLALETLTEHRRAGTSLRLVVELSEQALNPATLEALARDIERRGLPSFCLMLVFAACEIRQSSRDLKSLFEQLRRLGLRIWLSANAAGIDILTELDSLNFDGYAFQPEVFERDHATLRQLEDVSRICKRARERGRSCWVQNLRDPAVLAPLWSLGMDYVSADFLGPAGPRLDYRFGEVQVS